MVSKIANGTSNTEKIIGLLLGTLVVGSVVLLLFHTPPPDQYWNLSALLAGALAGIATTSRKEGS